MASSIKPYLNRQIKKIKQTFSHNPFSLISSFFVLLLFLISLLPFWDTGHFFHFTRGSLLNAFLLSLPVVAILFLLSQLPKINLDPLWSALSPVLIALFLLTMDFNFYFILIIGVLGIAAIEALPVLKHRNNIVKNAAPYRAGKVRGLPFSKLFFFSVLPGLWPDLKKVFLRCSLWILSLETIISFLGFAPENLNTWGKAIQQAYYDPSWPENWLAFLWPGIIFGAFFLALNYVERGQNNAGDY